MRVKYLDPAAHYLAMLDTWKSTNKPGVPLIVAVNFVLDAKIARGTRFAPERRIAKHYFPCDEALVPIHQSVGVLKRLVAFRAGSQRFPWSRLEGQELLIRFGSPRSEGLHNPVEEIWLPNSSLAEFPAAQEEKRDSSLKIDHNHFTVTWNGTTARFSDCNEFKLLVMLAEAMGDWVGHDRIVEEIIQDSEVCSNRCSPLKYRLAVKLGSQGLGALAEAIVSGTRRYRLSL
jgi:hypothetical protein